MPPCWHVYATASHFGHFFLNSAFPAERDVGVHGYVASFNKRVRAEGPITKEDEYRQNAPDTIQLAQRASSSSDKGRLLRLADAWLDLADRARNAARNLRRPTILHPLVQKKLDRYPD
jgi:hypothetical protein